MNFVNHLIGAVLLCTLAACMDSNGHEKSNPSKTVKSEWMSKVKQGDIVAGQALYQQYCSKCHGLNAEGAKDWKTPGLNGKFSPPPLDGTGHSWHHPMSMLMQVVRDGSKGGGEMPGWKERLSDEEIKSIISWTQSLWPEKHLQTWLEIDARSIQLFHSSD